MILKIYLFLSLINLDRIPKLQKIYDVNDNFIIIVRMENVERPYIRVHT